MAWLLRGCQLTRIHYAPATMTDSRHCDRLRPMFSGALLVFRPEPIEGHRRAPGRSCRVAVEDLQRVALAARQRECHLGGPLPALQVLPQQAIRVVSQLMARWRRIRVVEIGMGYQVGGARVFSGRT